MATIRRMSWETAEKLGYPKNESLPLLDSPEAVRTKNEVVDRLFCIHCVAAAAYGYDKKRALAWLNGEGGLTSLTSCERAFLEEANGNITAFREQIEANLALSWCLQIVGDLDFSMKCSSDFVKLFPDLKKDESGSRLRSQACLRPVNDLIVKCDLAYCLNWGIVHLEQSATIANQPVAPYIILERRRALEWVLSRDAWDEIRLDT